MHMVRFNGIEADYAHKEFMFQTYGLPCIRADNLYMIFSTFLSLHRIDHDGFHQKLLTMACKRIRILTFENVQKDPRLVWTEDAPSNNNVTFKQHLAEHGFDVSVFDN